MINEAAYDAWFIKVSNVTEQGVLLDPSEYEKACEEEKH